MSILYDVLINPLIVVYDFLFSIIYSFLELPVPSIFALSIIINIIVLPLYKKADYIQKQEQQKADSMKDRIKHIRRTFHGDEKIMMLSAYYKIEGYNPFNFIKEAVPLLLQIPFFIAAYRYITSLTIFEGESYGVIGDLLAPDSMLRFGNININVLPILMTAINLLSGYYYSKNSSIKQKLQIVITAVLFLVLLYNSPSILVIYWLCNNLFSLFKNLYYYYGEKLVIVKDILLPFILDVLVFFLVAIGFIDTELDVIIAFVILFFSIFKAMFFFIKKYLKNQPEVKNKIITAFYDKVKSAKASGPTMLISIMLPEICLVILLGFYIPTNVIASSVNEFVDKNSGVFYRDLITFPLLTYFGLILIWGTILLLSMDKVKRCISVAVMWGLVGIGLVDQFFFDPKVGILYSDLTFDNPVSYSMNMGIINILICVLIFVIFFIIYLRHMRVSKILAIVISVVLFAMFLWNVRTIYSGIKDPTSFRSDEKYPIKLSKNGKNVVVMMLDRAIGEYVPYIFDEEKELKESYSGFVNYPNTISFGTHTNYGAPPLFGGYEYIPSEMNKRDKEPLVKKHNEALKLMPAIFSKEGYNVMVSDPPYANYQEVSDLSIYDDMEGVNAFCLNGKYSKTFNVNHRDNIHSVQRHNFILYGLFRTVPLCLKNCIYNEGRYLRIDKESEYYSQPFVDSFSVINQLPYITDLVDDNENYFLLMQNDTPHNPVYDDSIKFEDRNYEGKKLRIDSYDEYMHYCVNVITYEELAKWIDFLKENDVYDNTRIILVSDHGYYLGQCDYLIHPDGLDIEAFRPLLMVKDFNSDKPMSSDITFMTNADVPTMAMDKIINNPVNPFTNNMINDEYKKKNKLLVTDSDNWMVNSNNGTTFELDNGHWWSVRDNVYDMNNWKKEK